jgi:peptidoglycan/LPS O-acetylase OafA/YrhL
MTRKLAPLEGQRGVAAIIVLIHHFILGFHPSVSGILTDTRTEDSLVGSLLFTLINGTGAVFFFFTLSGFVLSWGYFNNPRERELVWASLRRWPRLVGPVVVTCLTSAILFHAGAYSYSDAGAKSGSTWLQTFGYSSFHDIVPSFRLAAWQGLTTFMSGKYAMNTNLWTMVYEYYGSIIVFALCPLILKMNGRFMWGMVILISAISLLLQNAPTAISSLGFTFVVPFLVGLTVSKLFSAQARLQFNTGAAISLMALGLYLLGYFEPHGYYSWAKPIAWISPQAANSVIYSIGSGAIIAATMSNTRIFNSLDTSFMRNLGRLSFPLYLVHPLVLASVSSWLYLNTFPTGGIVLFTATFGLCLVFSIPLALFDEWWVKRVRSAFNNLRQLSAALLTSSPKS